MERVIPPCPHFQACGGCQYQDLSDESYRASKEHSVRDQLAADGILPEVWEESIFIPAGHRRRATFAARKEGRKVTLGFNAFRSHDLVDIPECLVVTPRLNAAIAPMRESLAAILPEGGSCDVFLQDVDGAIDCVLTGEAVCDPSTKHIGLLAKMAEGIGLARVSVRKGERDIPVPQIVLSDVRKHFGVLSVDIPPGAFLQPSEAGEVALARAVLNGVGKGSKKRKIADLFCGCGTFSGPLMGVGQVHALDGDRPAIKALAVAAKGHPQIVAEERDLFKESLTARELKNYDAVVFDPPRAGAKDQSQNLAKSSVTRIVAVSCNPQTFARDAKILIGGGYKLGTLQIVDQFVWSGHVEVVGSFYRL
jgi:23S rRNA (uracil1939-C5)-methyltransferase